MKPDANRIGSATNEPIRSTVFGASVPSPSSALTRRTSAITSTDWIEADPQVPGSASLDQVGVVDSDLGARQLADGLDQLAHVVVTARREDRLARSMVDGPARCERSADSPVGSATVGVDGSDGSAMVVSL